MSCSCDNFKSSSESLERANCAVRLKSARSITLRPRIVFSKLLTSNPVDAARGKGSTLPFNVLLALHVRLNGSGEEDLDVALLELCGLEVRLKGTGEDDFDADFCAPSLDVRMKASETECFPDSTSPTLDARTNEKVFTFRIPARSGWISVEKEQIHGRKQVSS